jgi:hypothetical protein
MLTFIQIPPPAGNAGANGGYAPVPSNQVYNNASMPNYVPAGTQRILGADPGSSGEYSVRYADQSGPNPPNGVDAAATLQGNEIGRITFDQYLGRWGFVLVQRGVSMPPALAATVGASLTQEISTFINGLSVPSATNLGSPTVAVFSAGYALVAGWATQYDVTLAQTDSNGDISGGAGSNNGVIGQKIGTIVWDWVMGRYHFASATPTNVIASSTIQNAIKSFIAGLNGPPQVDENGDAINLGEGWWKVPADAYTPGTVDSPVAY